MNILFRSDSSSRIGTGHIMRDLVLASQYPNNKIIFASINLSGNINHKVLEANYGLITLESNKKEELLSLIKDKEIGLLIIDHYEIDYEFERYIQENSDVKILVLDDTYQKHCCDVLMNHNIYADERKYKTLVKDGCELRCGEKFSLLRDEFTLQKNKISVFIAMGGADSANLNIKILDTLKKYENIEAKVVTTRANRNMEDLKLYASKNSWVNLYIESDSLAKLMRESDYAIVTPSVTLNEIYYMRVPFIAIKTENNQNFMYQYLQEKNYPVLDGFNEDMLKFELDMMNKKIQNER